MEHPNPSPIEARIIRDGSEVPLHHPVADAAKTAIAEAGVSVQFIDTFETAQRNLIRNQAAEVERTMPTRAETSVEDVYWPEDSTAEGEAARYLDFVEQTDTYMRLLGPTNTLRATKGYDASYEFGRLLHELRTGYDKLPVEMQTPELRITEAYVAQELALLWRADQVDFAKGRQGNVPKKNRALIANPEDPNIFSEEHIETISEQDRWAIIGSRLSDESAEVFESIEDSVHARAKAEARELTQDEQDMAEQMNTHAVDMRIRSLQIHLTRTDLEESDRQQVYEELSALTNEHASRIVTYFEVAKQEADRSAWSGDTKKRMGSLFELMVVAKKRLELFSRGVVSRTVRLATRREDKVHEDIRPLHNRPGSKIKLSRDVVEEGLDGSSSLSYQVKNARERNYDVRNIKTARDGTVIPETIYPDSQMIFSDQM